MDAHPEDAQQTVPDVVTEVAAEPADDAPAEGTPTLDAAAEDGLMIVAAAAPRE